MRIGIITFHRAHNYGAALQCYALLTFLQKLGHEVYVIDYNNKELWTSYAWFNLEDVKFVFQKSSKIPVRAYRLLKKWMRFLPRYNNFVKFQNHKLNMTPVSQIKENPFDLILIGSDQVWNLSLTHGFDPFYWGLFERPETTKVASYAASLKSIWTGDDSITAIKYLRKLDDISVREAEVSREIHQLDNGIAPKVHIDPVFLLTADDWKKTAKKPAITEPYIFFYQAMTSERILNEAKCLAEKEGKKLIILSADMPSPQSTETLSASPLDFIGWILYSDMVITSSFHATAFSLLFHKPFYCLNLNMGKDSRTRNVLTKFSQEERFVNSLNEITTIKKKQDDSILEIERMATKEYVSHLFTE